MAQSQSVRVVGRISIDGGAPQPCVVDGVATPLGFWGGSPPPYPDISPPADQPHPEHPIVIVPPGAIDGVHPEHPIYLPVYPAHPIELPPEEVAPPGFQWVYVEPYGWVLDPVGGGKPRPPG